MQAFLLPKHALRLYIRIYAQCELCLQSIGLPRTQVASVRLCRCALLQSPTAAQTCMLCSRRVSLIGSAQPYAALLLVTHLPLSLVYQEGDGTRNAQRCCAATCCPGCRHVHVTARASFVLGLLMAQSFDKDNPCCLRQAQTTKACVIQTPSQARIRDQGLGI